MRDDHDERREPPGITPPLRLLDLAREHSIVEADFGGGCLAALAHVRDPQIDSLVAQCRQASEQALRVGSWHVADEDSHRADLSSHRLGDEIGEHLCRRQSGRDTHMCPSGRVVIMVRPSAYALPYPDSTISPRNSSTLRRRSSSLIETIAAQNSSS